MAIFAVQFTQRLRHRLSVMIGLIGISHHTALVEIREQFFINPDTAPHLYQYINSRCPLDGIFVLSTCNRTELYVEKAMAEGTDERILLTVRDLFLQYYQASHLASHLYLKEDGEVIRHLFMVATGLDSMILGEYQIASQIKLAFAQMHNDGIMGPVLSRLIQKAFETSKKVRTQTVINRGFVSVSSAAVALAGQKLGCFKSARALTVGAGETGTVVALNLKKKKCKQLYISNRTLAKAETLAMRTGAAAVDFNRLNEYLAQVDVAIYTTGSREPLLTAALLEPIMQQRQGRPLLLIDLCVPRNIQPDVVKLPGVTLVDLDHLENEVRTNFDRRKGELEVAGYIIEQQALDFEDWLGFRALSGTITSLSGALKRVHHLLASNYTNPGNEILATEAVKDYGDYLSGKFTRLFIKQMRDITRDGRDIEKVKLLEEMFRDFEKQV
ncbi:MAG: glutamyl-tRNA reductase [Marinilabiliaceae bacterium]|nr:glutamyl-tRNA reductase [Marinilabiliaceae bacterium]